ncbi:MAG: hypothetical protein Q9169_008428 [Polycauliona sp. 2 TL-2023]
MFTPSLLILILLSILPFTSPLDCYAPPARTQLPIVDHCQELVYALLYASRLPHKNDPKTWGRGLRSTDFTEYLPKVYWLPGRGPRSCAVNLDVDPLHPEAREMFRLSDIATATIRMVNICLIGRREVGRDVLGSGGRVWAKLVRTDGPILVRGVGRDDESKGSVLVPGVGELMWMSGNSSEMVDEMR